MKSAFPRDSQGTGARALNKALALFLQTERKQAGTSVEQFASQLGIDIRTYRRLEAGIAVVRLSTLEPIANRLTCSVSELLRYIEQER